MGSVATFPLGATSVKKSDLPVLSTNDMPDGRRPALSLGLRGGRSKGWSSWRHISSCSVRGRGCQRWQFWKISISFLSKLIGRTFVCVLEAPYEQSCQP
jgi:hypothetical protein